MVLNLLIKNEKPEYMRHRRLKGNGLLSVYVDMSTTPQYLNTPKLIMSLTLCFVSFTLRVYQLTHALVLDITN